MENKSISLRQVIDRIKRHPILKNLNEEAIIDYTIDFFRIVGLPNAYQEKTCLVKIHNYKGKLPDDYIEPIQLRYIDYNPDEFKYDTQYSKESVVYYDNNVWKFVKDKNEGPWDPTIVEEASINNRGVAYYRYSGDSFHMSTNKINSAALTYKVQGSCIVTSEQECMTELAYYAIEVDKCGLPVIPDNSKFIRALENYIKVQYFTIQYELGKLNANILQHAEQEYCWSVGACESDFHSITLDKLESIANLAKSLLPRNLGHHNGYSFTGDKELIKTH